MSDEVIVPGCNAGQQPSLRRLQAWFARLEQATPDGAEPGRRRQVSPPPGGGAEPQPSGAAPAATPALPGSPTAAVPDLDDAAVQCLTAEQVAWHSAPGSSDDDGSGVRALGDAALWDCLGEAVQWCDLAVIGWFAGGPQVLPVQLAPCARSPARRLALVIAHADCDALDAAGAAPERIGAALDDAARNIWLVRADGAGAFVSIGLHLTAAEE